MNRRDFLALGAVALGAGAAGYAVGRRRRPRFPLALGPDERRTLEAMALRRSKGALLGCGWPSPSIVAPDRYTAMQAKFLAVFDALTPDNALKWSSIQPAADRWQWADADAVVKWAGEHKIDVRMHTALWDSPQGRPLWTGGLDDQALHSAVIAFVTAVAQRYKGRFYAWDIVNEPLHNAWYTKRFPGLAREIIGLVRGIDPRPSLVVNEYNAVLYPTGGEHTCTAALADYARDIGADGVGLEMHDDRWFTGQEIRATLNFFASKGLSVHLTEITRPSEGSRIYVGEKANSDALPGDVAPYGDWSEDAQAAAYSDIVRIGMAHDAVKAITVWSLCDTDCWSLRWRTGVLRPDMTAKPAYEALCAAAKACGAGSQGRLAERPAAGGRGLMT